MLKQYKENMKIAEDKDGVSDNAEINTFVKPEKQVWSNRRMCVAFLPCKWLEVMRKSIFNTEQMLRM